MILRISPKLLAKTSLTLPLQALQPKVAAAAIHRILVGVVHPVTDRPIEGLHDVAEPGEVVFVNGARIVQRLAGPMVGRKVQR